jgi:hypothetical protein
VNNDNWTRVSTTRHDTQTVRTNQAVRPSRQTLGLTERAAGHQTGKHTDCLDPKRQDSQEDRTHILALRNGGHNTQSGKQDTMQEDHRQTGKAQVNYTISQARQKAGRTQSGRQDTRQKEDSQSTKTQCRMITIRQVDQW